MNVAEWLTQNTQRFWTNISLLTTTCRRVTRVSSSWRCLAILQKRYHSITLLFWYRSGHTFHAIDFYPSLVIFTVIVVTSRNAEWQMWVRGSWIQTSQTWIPLSSDTDSEVEVRYKLLQINRHGRLRSNYERWGNRWRGRGQRSRTWVLTVIDTCIFCIILTTKPRVHALSVRWFWFIKILKFFHGDIHNLIHNNESYLPTRSEPIFVCRFLILRSIFIICS